MSLLTPLGLLALLSIVALIIIYIIRPNYQEKYLSTTFIWKLSLKYRKKRIPTSRLRNILLIICQVLALLLATIILTTPSEVLKAQVEEAEVIIVIDSSASMRTASSTEDDPQVTTRYERALAESKKKADEIIEANGIVSFILADETPSMLATGVKKENKDVIDALYESLTSTDSCSYGTSDIEKAIDLCADIFAENPSAQIFIYTDNQYGSVPASGITVVDVTAPEEWNAAILSAVAEKVNGYYLINVDLACYNRSQFIDVEVTIHDVNGNSELLDTVETVTIECLENVPTKLLLISDQDHADYIANYNTTDTGAENYVTIADIGKVYSFSSINLTIVGADDCLEQDDIFNIYGGELEEMRVEYYSSEPNYFTSTILDVLRNYYTERGMWDFLPFERTGENIEMTGYDFYIFEHVMPTTLPTDGVVFLIDPDTAPIGAGFNVSGTWDFGGVSMFLNAVDDHPIGRNIVADEITVSRYQRLAAVDGDYTVVMEIDGYPILMVKNDGPLKIVVLAFSLHYSNFSIKSFYPLFLLDVFNYFMPMTVDANYFEVGEQVSLRARGSALSVEGNDVDVTFEAYDGAETPITFPVQMSFDQPGTYTISQTDDFGNFISEFIFIKAPAAESNIFSVEQSLVNPYTTVEITDFYRDLLLYFAIALVAILFIEWILQARDNM